MPENPIKPFLITKDEDGHVHLTVRETRYNSQGYPWSVPKLIDETFTTVSAARAYAVDRFGAKAGEFSSK